MWKTEVFCQPSVVAITRTPADGSAEIAEGTVVSVGISFRLRSCPETIPDSKKKQAMAAG